MMKVQKSSATHTSPLEKRIKEYLNYSLKCSPFLLKSIEGMCELLKDFVSLLLSLLICY